MKLDRSSAATIGSLAHETDLGWRATRVPSATLTESLAYLSAAFDLAESQPLGHAARVAYLAVGAAERLGLNAQARHDVLMASLLHDSGVAVRTLPSEVSPQGGHTAAGAWVAARLGLGEAAQGAIRNSHERWDGTGRPLGLAEDAIPVEALLVAGAHWASDQADGLDNLLLARARLARHRAGEWIPVMGPRVAPALQSLLSADSTWIAMSDRSLPTLISAGAGDDEASAEAVENIARVLGEVIDAAAREPGRAERVSALAVELGRSAGMPAAMLRAMRVAGNLLDLGFLGVPRHITEKPAILTIEEMETMQRHASTGARIVETLPGLEVVAHWIEAHHERIDGRGYPEMLSGDDIPLASRILAVADAYCALRVDRPHRKGFSAEQALVIIEESAGTQFDAGVIEMLDGALNVVEDAA